MIEIQNVTPPITNLNVSHVVDSQSSRCQPVSAVKKTRLYYIDNLRVLACFLVLLTHSTMPAVNADKEGFWMFTLSFIGSPSSELFLALSGTVLLPIKKGIREFYSRRFLKLLPPVIFWSIVGTFILILFDKFTFDSALSAIAYMPLRPVIGVYWFIYVMVGLYLFAPVISAFLSTASKRRIELYLCLWGVTLIMPWFYGLISDTFNQDGSHYWTLNYFGGFLGYWVLGYYLNKYPINIGWNKKWITLLILSLIYPLSVLIMKLSGVETEEYTDNLQLGSAVLVALLYTVVQKIRFGNRIQTFLTAVAKYSFGIYLIHILVRNCVWQLFQNSQIHTFPRTFIMAGIAMAASWLIIWCLSKLPYGKYITGA